MKNIAVAALSKYKNNQEYESIGSGIHKDLRSKRYVIALRFELEENEDSQYPLEYVLDKYCVNCTDHIEINYNANVLEVEIEDSNGEDFESLESIKHVAALVGKRVYCREGHDGTALIIE